VESALAWVGLEAVWPESVVLAGGVGAGSVGSHGTGSGARSVGRVEAESSSMEPTRLLVVPGCVLRPRWLSCVFISFGLLLAGGWALVLHLPLPLERTIHRRFHTL